jgi:hypothetical protein
MDDPAEGIRVIANDVFRDVGCASRGLEKEVGDMKSRLVGLVALAALITALALPASALAESPVVERFRNHGTETLDPDNLCGFDGSSVFEFTSTVTLYADESFKDVGSFKHTFTSDDGKVVRIHSAGLVRGTAVIDEDAGTISFTTTFKGLPEQVKGAHGGRLIRDAGIATFTDVFDLDTGDFIETIITTKGPHPDLDSDFALFCEAVTAALS